MVLLKCGSRCSISFWNQPSARPLRGVLLAALVFASLAIPLGSAAQQISDEMRQDLFLTTVILHALAVRCSQADPQQTNPKEMVSRLEEVHAPDIAAGNAIVSKKLAATGVSGKQVLARAIITSGAILRLPPDAVRRECDKVVNQARSLAASSHADLLQRTFDAWLSKVEIRQAMSCASLHDRLRALAPRYIASIERMGAKKFDDVDMLLPADLDKLEQAALTCQAAQAIAGKEDINMPGSYATLAATLTALADAASPLLRNGRHPLNEVEAVDLLNSYLATSSR